MLASEKIKLSKLQKGRAKLTVAKQEDYFLNFIDNIGATLYEADSNRNQTIKQGLRVTAAHEISKTIKNEFHVSQASRVETKTYEWTRG